MSIYSVHKIAHLLGKDAEFRRRLKADPAATIASFRLTDAERAALLAGEVGTLEAMGAHGFLLTRFARHEVFGLTMASYVHRIHERPGS